MGTGCTDRGDLHPPPEQCLDLGFELGEVEVGTGFLHDDHQLGDVSTELIPCRVASSAKRPAFCRSRRSSAADSAIDHKRARSTRAVSSRRAAPRPERHVLTSDAGVTSHRDGSVHGASFA